MYRYLSNYVSFHWFKHFWQRPPIPIPESRVGLGQTAEARQRLGQQQLHFHAALAHGLVEVHAVRLNLYLKKKAGESHDITHKHTHIIYMYVNIQHTYHIENTCVYIDTIYIYVCICICICIWYIILLLSLLLLYLLLLLLYIILIIIISSSSGSSSSSSSSIDYICIYKLGTNYDIHLQFVDVYEHTL